MSEPSLVRANFRHWPGKKHWRPPREAPVERIGGRLCLTMLSLPERGQIPERFGLGAFMVSTGSVVLDAGLVYDDSLSEHDPEALDARSWSGHGAILSRPRLRFVTDECSHCLSSTRRCSPDVATPVGGSSRVPISDGPWRSELTISRRPVSTAGRTGSRSGCAASAWSLPSGDDPSGFTARVGASSTSKPCRPMAPAQASADHAPASTPRARSPRDEESGSRTATASSPTTRVASSSCSVRATA